MNLLVMNMEGLSFWLMNYRSYKFKLTYKLKEITPLYREKEMAYTMCIKIHIKLIIYDMFPQKKNLWYGRQQKVETKLLQ